jgi:hypothetical protein
MSELNTASMRPLTPYKPPSRFPRPSRAFLRDPPCEIPLSAQAFISGLLNADSRTVADCLPDIEAAQAEMLHLLPCCDDLHSSLAVLAQSAALRPIPYSDEAVDFFFPPHVPETWKACAMILEHWFRNDDSLQQLLAHNVVDRILGLPSTFFTARLIRLILERMPEHPLAPALYARLLFFIESAVEIENLCESIETIAFLAERGVGALCDPGEMEKLIVRFLTVGDTRVQRSAVRMAELLSIFTQRTITIVTAFLTSVDAALVGVSLRFISALTLKWEVGELMPDPALITAVCAVVEDGTFANACRAIEILIESTRYGEIPGVFEMIARYVDKSLLGRYAFCVLAWQFLAETDPVRAILLLELVADKLDVIAQDEEEDSPLAAVACMIRDRAVAA